MVWRMREAFSVVPRSLATSSGISTLNGAFEAPDGAPAAGADAGAFSAAVSTSCLRMRPPTPVPVTCEWSPPLSRARRRPRGEAYAVFENQLTPVGAGALAPLAQTSG